MRKPAKHFYEFGPFRLDPAERLLWRDAEVIPLTPKAFETLLALIEQPQRVLTKDELMEKVWPESYVEETNLAQNISTLRKRLGEQPTGGPYIETVPRRGYRFVTEVHEEWLEPEGELTAAEVISGTPELPAPPPAPAAQIDTDVAIQPEVRRGVRPDSAGPGVSRRAVALALGGALALAAAASLFFFRESLRNAPGSAKPRRLVILPFRNLKPDPETDFLSLSLADAVIAKLSYISALTVPASAYIEKYRNQEFDRRKVAEEFKADALLTGTFVRDGQDLRINVQLIDVRADEVIWSEPLDLKYEEGLLTIQDQVAREVIKGLQVNLTPVETERIKRDVPRNPEAYEDHLRGVDLYHANELSEAARMLQRSVERDPNFALSWAYLGTVYTTTASLHFGGRDEYAKAQAAYDQALFLNPGQIEARIFLAALLTDTGRVEQSVPLLREVLQINPNHGRGHWELAYAYRFGGMLKESIGEGELSRQIEGEIRSNNSVFNSYLYDGQHERFLKSLPAKEREPFIIFYRGLANYYLGRIPEAVADFDRAYELDPSLLQAQIGKALGSALTGQSAQGVALLRATEKLIEERGVRDPEAIYKVAQAYSLLGDRAAALGVLRRSIEGGFFCYPYLVTDKLLDPLRGDPSFTALLELARSRHEEFRRRFF
ncbi:MAG TPA: winged helix-turn-helix domain-containing protein [Blastocatellia bacterium]|nr:winged helix-turn-helix domain-containing protein [Blastocatellia bacterium]